MSSPSGWRCFLRRSDKRLPCHCRYLSEGARRIDAPTRRVKPQGDQAREKPVQIPEDSTRNPIFNFKISGIYHRVTENTEVWENNAKHFMMLLRELRVLCVSVVKLLGTNFLLQISGSTANGREWTRIRSKWLRKMGYGGYDLEIFPQNIHNNPRFASIRVHSRFLFSLA